MTNAVINSRSYIGDNTQVSFINNLTVSMLEAGFTLSDSYVSSANEGRIFSYIANPNKTYGTMLLRVLFASPTSLTFSGGSSYNKATRSLNDANTSTTTIGLLNPYIFLSINHPEIRGVLTFFNGSVTPNLFIGYLRPLNLPDWWDESLYAWGFKDNSSGAFSTNSMTGSLTTISNLRYSQLSGVYNVSSLYYACRPNPLVGNIRPLTQAILVDTATSILISTFSQDIVMGSASGMQALDVFQVILGIEEYTLIEPGSTVYQRMGLRTL
jgi:hypothetical protein